jgi:hypothetical protein
MNDKSRRTIDLVLEVEEGQAFDFGKLYLEGVEPRPGAGKTLLDSWKPLEGRRYNPVELQHWLLANPFRLEGQFTGFSQRMIRAFLWSM